MLPNSENNPLALVFQEASDLVENGGATVYQKFTCANCGKRLIIDVPNTFYQEGSCDTCGHVTDIKKDGCNFLAVFRVEDVKPKLDS